jgi:DNA polymerase type B, organellar and viral
VFDKKTKQKVTFLDSLNIVKNSLDVALKAFNCTVKKGKLPYKFYNSDTLHYIGKLPEYKYYSDITELDYNKLLESQIQLFDAKKECLDYLRKDVLGLLELMIKISNYFYENYSYT